MPSWWCPGRWSRTNKGKNEPSPTAATSPRRHSDDDDVPNKHAAFAFAWAAPPVGRSGGERPRSFDSPAARRGTFCAATRCCGGSEGAVVVPEQGFPLPWPKSGQLRLESFLRAEAAPCRGCASVSGGSSSESDDAVEHHRNEDPAVHPGARDVNLQSFGASTGSTPSRGRMLHEETRGARTRSLSPGPRGHALASSYASPAGDLGFGPWSTVKRVDDLKSRSQPLPLPPAPITIGFLAPSSLPIASSLSQSPWKKGKLLGSGTFGQVYLGFNSESGKLCAIKEVQVVLDDPKSKERLRQLNQEIDMLRQLSHQNIVQYYGSELSDETLSIYLEYVSGGSIYNLLRDYGPFTEPVICNYTRQILRGLAYLHGRKTLHRDIKGANILVCPNGEVKLADFGVAKHITSLAEIRSFRGSPYWMAPEVIRNNKGYSLEVDIWSLGCTIIEMGTGRHPWHQYADVPAMFKIAYSKDVPDIPESFSKDGKDFLRLCLKRDPAQRPSATQLLGHPFLQEHQGTRVTKCNNIAPLRNRPSFTAEAWQQESRRGYSSAKRSIAPLLDIKGQSARDFTGFSTAHPSSGKASSIRIDARKNMSLPVSPCSSPLRQLKQSNWSCLPSPSHPAFSSSGSTAYNPVSNMQNQTTMRNTTAHDPWHDIGHRPQSSYGSPKRF